MNPESIVSVLPRVMPVHFVIAGPVAPFQKKVASWLAKDGRHGTHAYDNGPYARWKPQAHYAAQQAMGNDPPIQGPVTCVLRIFMEIPASKSAKQRRMMEAGFIRPTITPDLDNCMKAISDSCLTGVVIRDDKFIVSATIEKYYSYKPRTEVTVVPWQPAPDASLFDIQK